MTDDRRQPGTASRQSALPRSRFLQIDRDVQGWRFHLAGCLAECLGLTLRERELRRCVERHLDRLGRTRWQAEEKTLLLLDSASISGSFIMEMDRAIEALARRPLSPRVVERVLNITGRERIRWGKDGRLPISGTASFRRGRLITVTTHPVDAIARLAVDSSIIASWRLADSNDA